MMANRGEFWIENHNISEIMSINDNFDWHNLWKIGESLDRSIYVSKDMSNWEELECQKIVANKRELWTDQFMSPKICPIKKS